MKSAAASLTYSAVQMQDVRRRLLRAEEQRDAAAATLATLLARCEEVAGMSPGNAAWDSLTAAIDAAAIDAAKVNA